MPLVTRVPTQDDLAAQATQLTLLAWWISQSPRILAAVFLLAFLPAGAWHLTQSTLAGLGDTTASLVAFLPWLAAGAGAVALAKRVPSGDVTALMENGLRTITAGEHDEKTFWADDQNV